MYRDDDDLEFLGKVKSEDLNDLVHLLIYDKDGIERLTEELSYRDSYKRYSPDHHQYWEDIAGELQCYGANTLVTIFRGGKGVLYKEILCNVCNEMKVNFNKNSSTERIEDCLFMKILEKSFENMSQDEINKLARDLGFTNISSVTPQMLLAACQAAFGAGGFASYQLALIIANAVWKALFGAGLSFATNATITRALSVLTGPIGWAITAIWTVVDIAGPATRVTVPGVIQIALLRRKFNSGDDGSKNGGENLPILTF